jgi:Pyruvate phosphate dikinase, AMP/ATP-binding domain
MDRDTENIPHILELFLQISQYPILGGRIRARMRQELFARGVISRERFEREVKEKAVRSQQHEGISDPLKQETAEVWQARVAQVRDHLTDFYFAYNLPHALFEEIVRTVLAERAPSQPVTLSFNPELAPWHMLLSQARDYANLPPEQRQRVSHHLTEITVVLIKTMISDQMAFIRLGREFLDIDVLEQIAAHRIGEGKIGGKAAGMLLAWKMLQREDPADEVSLCGKVVIPDSYYIGADVFYDFMALNGLDQFINQKYKTPEEIQADYPLIQQTYASARFPEGVLERLRALLAEVADAPLIVRSSSLLEDNFGHSFAGKYESTFCANQGTPDENLRALTHAISQTYASVLGPDALVYRRQMGLVDYDERMAILIQKVQGQRYRDWYLPTLAGVGFSRNPFRWNRKIRMQDGLLRLVWGLGTRAVERTGNDYPRMVALSHPELRPETGAGQIRRYSQHFVDLIDLPNNALVTLQVGEVLSGDYRELQLLASRDRGDYVQPIYASSALDQGPLVLTFNELLKNREFVALMRTTLHKLEQELHIPRDVPPQEVIFRGRRVVPHGRVERIRYIVYVDPIQYDHVPDYTVRFELARVVGRLNKRLEGERFILMGPGRWGSSNVELGVKVTYADIYNARALIEIALSRSDCTPEVSYGTHFFQDLVETGIYPLPLYPDAPDSAFNRAFFAETPNVLGELSPQDERFAPYVKVIDVPSAAAGRYLELVMDSNQEEALAYLKSEA